MGQIFSIKAFIDEIFSKGTQCAANWNEKDKSIEVSSIRENSDDGDAGESYIIGLTRYYSR